MQSMSDLMGDFYKRVVVGQKFCEYCDSQYEVYDYYIKGEKKGTVDFCVSCYQLRQDREIAREALQQRKLAMMNEYNKISVVPYGLENASFATYKPETKSQKEALEVSKQFATGDCDKTTLFFQGDTGLGKTHLSYSIYQTFIESEQTAIFVDMPSLLTLIRSTFNGYNLDRELDQEKIMRAIRDCDLLVLDDIGAEYVKPDENGYESWVADILFQIVNSRLGKKNVYTTNFSSKHLAKKYGMMSKRILSRMLNNAKILKLDGQDYRLRGLD